MLRSLVLWLGALCAGAAAATVTLPRPYQAIGTEWSVAKAFGKDRSSLTSHLGDRELRAGDFVVRWEKAQARLRIDSVARPGALLWSTVPHRAFVQAAKGRETVEQWRGSFNILDRPDGRRCFRQTLDRLSSVGNAVVVRGRLSGDGCDLRYELRFTPLTERRLGFALSFSSRQGEPVGDDVVNRSLLVYASHAKEHFYGFGEQFTYFDLKGRLVPIFGQEQGHLRGVQPATHLLNRLSPGAAGAWHTTYTAVPFYATSDLRGLLLDQTEYLYFDLQDDERVEARVWASSLRGQLIDAASPLELIEAHTEVTGRMPPLPDWFHQGAIVGLMGGQDFITQIHAKLRERETPITAYWIQDWVGKRRTELGVRMWWNWELDLLTYPNWDQLTAELRGEGIRTLGYINPFLTDASGKSGVRRNLFAEAKERGFLVRKQDGSPYEIGSGGFTGTLVDLTNPEARAWLKTSVKDELFSRGFSGWMADFGEALPLDAILHGDVPASRFHNQYLTEWSRLNREIVEEAGKLGEAVFFVRAAGLRSPAFATMFWIGDQLTSWDEHDGLKSSITGLLSGGVSGLALNHGDIGGLITLKRSFLGIPLVNIYRDKELMLRWLEMSAFTPVFRTHEGNSPEQSHQFYSDDETLDAYAYFAKVFAALFDYRKPLIEEASARGLPVLRHPWLHFPDDEVVQELRFQFMLGPDFMVAPVTDPQRTEQTLYLPAGRWVDLWSGEERVSSGAWHTVAAPLGFPPVHFRAEASAAWAAHERIKGIARPTSSAGATR